MSPFRTKLFVLRGWSHLLREPLELRPPTHAHPPTQIKQIKPSITPSTAPPGNFSNNALQMWMGLCRLMGPSVCARAF